MMLKKGIITLFSCLMPISIFGIGFSSFLITSSETSISMQFQVAEISDISNAITFEEELNELSYCEYGFINGEVIEPKVCLNATIRFNIEILKPILDSIINFGTMNVNFSLVESSSIGIINNYSNNQTALFTIKSPTIGTIPVINADNSSSNNEFLSIVSISNIIQNLQYISLNINYCFDLTSGITADFKTDIYPLINGLSFNLSVEIKS